MPKQFPRVTFEGAILTHGDCKKLASWTKGKLCNDSMSQSVTVADSLLF